MNVRTPYGGTVFLSSSSSHHGRGDRYRRSTVPGVRVGFRPSALHFFIKFAVHFLEFAGTLGKAHHDGTSGRFHHKENRTAHVETDQEAQPKGAQVGRATHAPRPNGTEGARQGRHPQIGQEQDTENETIRNKGRPAALFKESHHVATGRQVIVAVCQEQGEMRG